MDLLFLGLSVIVGDAMSVPKACIDCKFLEGKTYGGNLLVCGMHPYGPSDDACDDFEKTEDDPVFSFSSLALEVERIVRDFLGQVYPHLREQTFLIGSGSSPSIDLSVHLYARRANPGAGAVAQSPNIRIAKRPSEWRSLKESGTLKAWIEAWLEEQIAYRQIAGELPPPNSGGAIAEEFWQDIRSALALCFPGSGEWSCRKREYLPSDVYVFDARNNIYEFDTRSPSGELVRFNVSVNPTLSHELLLRELIGAIQQSSARTRETERYSFLFEDGLTETEDEEEWLYSRLRAVLRRCFPWADRWSIEDVQTLFGGCSMECATHRARILIACRERSKERKLAALSREIEQQSERMRDRPQFRHLFEPPNGGRVLPVGSYTPQNCRCVPEGRRHRIMIPYGLDGLGHDDQRMEH